MDVIFFWIVASIGIAFWAARKGRSPFGWLVLSLVLSPLLSAIFLAVASDKSPQGQERQPTPDTHVRCPDCRELVRRDARKCRHCGTLLLPS